MNNKLRPMTLVIIVIILCIVQVFCIGPEHLITKLVLNIIEWWLVFCIFYLLIQEKRRCRLESHNLKREDSRVLNLIIPGFLRPPAEKLKILAECMVGDVVILTYDNAYWDSQSLKNQLAQILTEEVLTAHFDRKPYEEIRIFAISMGCKLLADLRIETNAKVSFYAINPCINASDLHDSLRKPLQIIVPIASVIISALGPFGDIPLVRKDSVNHSLNEVATEGLALMFDRNLTMPPDTKYIFNRSIKDGTGDEFTDLRSLKASCIKAKTDYTIISAEHAHFTKYEDEFLGALLKLGAFDAPKP